MRADVIAGGDGESAGSGPAGTAPETDGTAESVRTGSTPETDEDRADGDESTPGTAASAGSGGPGSTSPGDRPGRRLLPAMSTSVLTAVWVLLIGALIAVASTVNWHTEKPARAAHEEPVTGPSASASPGPTVQGDLDSAERVTANPSKKSEPPAPPRRVAQPPVRQAPPPAKTPPRRPEKPAGPVPVSSWKLGSGRQDLGADEQNANPLLLQNVTKGSGHGGSAVFNGRDSQAYTGGPVLDTRAGSSFTVSAWVYLNKTGALYTAVSQDSVNNSSFYLEYSQEEHRWAFARVLTDKIGAKPVRAVSADAPKLNTWTHLVGVFDAASNRVLLYVNGRHEGTTYDPSPYGSNGPLVIGRAKAAGGYTNWWPGQINDVAVYPVALTEAQVKAL
ncbi:LamG-like jellyroll fold domain-containing protein [Streptomyces coelicoflavus]|uniref:LamG-like jellyroll fold domain-containing protein n=1 Tax=Streptomyces coelicoflavus TaxID=285562 RepID=UPI002E27147C